MCQHRHAARGVYCIYNVLGGDGLTALRVQRGRAICKQANDMINPHSRIAHTDVILRAGKDRQLRDRIRFPIYPVIRQGDRIVSRITVK